MLTADHVRVRRKGNELSIVPLAREMRERAEILAEGLLDEARAGVGKSREELDAAWDDVVSAAGENELQPRIAAGIRKLVEDACTFDADTGKVAYEMRRALFVRASEVRRALADGEQFDRDAVLAEVAEQRGMKPEILERGLFSDLRRADVLVSAPIEDASSILSLYDLGQAQAVLLRAVRVTCDIHHASPGAVRAFFDRLKFHKLLFVAQRIPEENEDEAGFRVVIDGPFSMFESVTKYGLRMAILLPALRQLERWSLSADVRWGKERTLSTFHLKSAREPTGPAKKGRAAEIHLSDELRELVGGIERANTAWRVEPATKVLDLPGQGLCIPDLVLRHPERKKPVFVEVLGFWSRDAVWRRVELARAGLKSKIVFAVSSKLRVSREVLADDVDAALYVYKGKMNARALLKHVEDLSNVS